MDNLFLCFIALVGTESDGQYRYEFIYTDNIDEVWGDNFDYVPACLCNGLYPNDEYITEVEIVKLPCKLNLIQENCCFGMQDCYDGIIALAYTDDEEPIVFNSGEEKTKIKLLISQIDEKAR